MSWRNGIGADGQLGTQRQETSFLGRLASPVGAVARTPSRLNNYFFVEPANQIKQAYDQAAGMSATNAQQLMDFYMKQQAKAQGFYKPLQDMFNRTYGTQGIQAPMTPQVPNAMPIQSMYQGSRR